MRLPAWHAHPDVWLLVIVLEGAYLWALSRCRPAPMPGSEHDEPAVAGGGRRGARAPRDPLPEPRPAVRGGHADVVAGGEPAAGDADALVSGAHGLPVPAVHRADRAGFVPDVRQFAALPLLRARSASL